MRWLGLSLLCAVLIAAPLWGDVSIDSQVSGDSQTAVSSITTPAISTNSGNELLLAFVATDALSSKITVTGVTGGGLTWSLVDRTNTQIRHLLRYGELLRSAPVTNAHDHCKSVAESVREYFGYELQWRRCNRR